MSEESEEFGHDFLMNIAKSWEEAFNSIDNPKTRKIIIRTSIVLGSHGGAIVPLKKHTKIGLGRKQGSGNQKVSWIHETDFARTIDFLINNEKLSGVFNLSVPKPTDNRTLIKSLQKALKTPFELPHPRALLELGTKLIGTKTELILKSRNVIPKRLLDHGFSFNHTDIQEALYDLTND